MANVPPDYDPDSVRRTLLSNADLIRTRLEGLKGAKQGATAPTQLAPIPMRTTRPKELLRHDISDEELEMLCENRRESLVEALWASIGVCAGSSIPSIQAIHSAYFAAEPSPLAVVDLLQICFFVLSAGLAATLFIIIKNRGARQSTLVDKIRARQAAA